MKGAYAAYLGERWWAASYALADRIQRDENQGSDEDYIDLIAATSQAATADAGNVMYSYWLAYYRWEAISRTTNPESQETLLPPEAKEVVTKIAEELAGNKLACATYGPTYALEGQLRLHVLGERRGAELIRKGHWLAPYDPPTCFVAGELAAREGKLEEAKHLLSRAVALQANFYSEAIRIFLFELDRPELARELAGNDYARLQELAEMCASDRRYETMAADLRSDAEASLRLVAARADASASDLATLAGIDFDRGNYDSAIMLYRRALSKEYRQVRWRLNLARGLAETGHVDEAIHETRICLRFRSNDATARRLLEELQKRADEKTVNDEKLTEDKAKK